MEAIKDLIKFLPESAVESAKIQIKALKEKLWQPTVTSLDELPENIA